MFFAKTLPNQIALILHQAKQKRYSSISYYEVKYTIDHSLDASNQPQTKQPDYLASGQY